MPARDLEPIGILDVGSNSIRLVVYEPPYLGEHPVFNEKVQCGLGADLATTGKLSVEGKTCTLETLAGFKSLAKAMDVQKIFVIGTAAIRDATDGPDFVKTIKDKTGFDVDVVAGEKEAYYSALGVLTAFPHGKGIVGDLGGGSLELAKIGQSAVGNPVSYSVGALRIMAQRNPKDFITEQLKFIDQNLCEDKLFYAVGGTWRTLAFLHQASRRKKAYNLESYRISAKEMIEFANVIATKSGEEMVEKYHVEHRRADLLPYSALLMAMLLKKLKSKTVIFTSTSLREGKLYELLKQSPLPLGA